jgi:hypothetical protein
MAGGRRPGFAAQLAKDPEEPLPHSGPCLVIILCQLDYNIIQYYTTNIN